MFNFFKSNKKAKAISEAPHWLLSVHMCEHKSHDIESLIALGNEDKAKEAYSSLIKFIYGTESNSSSNEELNLFNYKLAYSTIPELLFTENGLNEFRAKHESLGTRFDLFLIILCAQDEIKKLPFHYNKKFYSMYSHSNASQPRPNGKPYYNMIIFPDMDAPSYNDIINIKPGCLRTHSCCVVEDQKNKSVRYFVCSDSTEQTFSIREVSKTGNYKIREINDKNNFLKTVNEIMNNFI